MKVHQRMFSTSFPGEYVWKSVGGWITVLITELINMEECEEQGKDIGKRQSPSF